MAFTNEERLFEKDAVSQSVSYPQTAMLRAMGLLGAEYSDDIVQKLKDEFLYTNSFTKDARGLIGYQVNIPDEGQMVNIDFFVEEIIAMIFQHAKSLAKKQADGAVTDVTITVPSYFTINQRIMIKDAAELAGFNVLTLLNENTAAALMYGIDTINMQTPRTVLLVNMGATDLELSLVKYDTVIEKGKKDKEILSVHVLDEAASPNVGGHRFDVELVKILAERFDSLPERVGKESILKDDRIVRRLTREVKRLKEVLSANKSVPVKLLEIADGLNLDFTLEREEFEARISDIVKQSKFAFDKILAKYPPEQIDEIEILGGGLRVPMVKDYIAELVGNKTLSTHLNPDEAMAFGSAYIAANFSSSYQVKQVYLYQSIPESIYLNITQMECCEAEDREDCFKKHLLLYDEAKNVLGQKKNINIENHIENMDLVFYTIDEDGNEHTVRVNFSNLLYTWLQVLTGKIRGIETAKTSPIFARDTVTKKKLSLTFKYDKSGILSVKKGEVLVIETVEEKPKKKKGSEKNETDTSEDDKPKTREKTVSFTISLNDFQHTFTLKVTEKFEGPQPLTAAQKSKAKKRASDADQSDKVQEKKKVMRNEYETLIYSARDFIQDEDIVPYLANEDEKAKILLLLDEEEDWLYGDGITASYDTLKNKLKVLEKKINPIKKRKTARDELPNEIEKGRKQLDESEKGFVKYAKKRSWLPQEELDEYHKLLTEKREYLDTKYEELKTSPLNKKVPFTVGEVRAEVNLVVEKLKFIKRIQKPKTGPKDVESHGELIEKPEGSDTESPRVETTDSDTGDEDGEPKIVTDAEQDLGKGRMPQGMKEQVDRLLKKQKLKDDVVSGKINVEDLTKEQLADLDLQHTLLFQLDSK